MPEPTIAVVSTAFVRSNATPVQKSGIDFKATTGLGFTVKVNDAGVLEQVTPLIVRCLVNVYVPLFRTVKLEMFVGDNGVVLPGGVIIMLSPPKLGT